MLLLNDATAGTSEASFERTRSSASAQGAADCDLREDAEVKAKGLRISPFYCEACRSPVVYTYGSPNVFAGVAQGCFPRGTQLREGSSLVNYFSDGKPVSNSCHVYFSSLKQSEVSEEIIEALQAAGMIKEGEHSNQSFSFAGSEVASHRRRRVNPWPISGAPRLPTNSARIKGLGSGINYLSTSTVGVGVEDKRSMESQYIPQTCHLTIEEPRKDIYGYPIIVPTTCSAVEQLQNSARAKVTEKRPPPLSAISSGTPNFRISSSGAVLARPPFASQLSGTTPWSHSEITSKSLRP